MNKGKHTDYSEYAQYNNLSGESFMSNFLPAAMINETLEDICEKIADLKLQINEGNNEQNEEIINELTVIEEIALDLWVFIERFPCQPLIYTGQGSTDEIIKRLDWALTFTEGVDYGDLFNKALRKTK